jgi:hypothetical protein
MTTAATVTHVYQSAQNHRIGGSTATDGFRGAIWDVRFYQSYLSDADLNSLAVGQTIVPSPTARWDMNEGTGTSVTATFGGNNGSFSGSGLSWTTVDDGLSVNSVFLRPARRLQHLLVR